MTPRIDAGTSTPQRQKLPELPTPPENLARLFLEPSETPSAPIGEVQHLPKDEEGDLSTIFQSTLTLEPLELTEALPQYDTKDHLLRLLQDNDLLTDENRKIVMEHEDPDSLLCAVVDLCAMGKLNQEMFLKIAKHSNPNIISQTLSELHQSTLLTKEILDLVFIHKDPQLIYTLIEILKKIGRFTQVGFLYTLKHPSPASLAVYFSLLIEGKLRVDKYYDIAFREINLTLLVQVMNILRNARILTDENFTLAFNYPKLDENLLSAFNILIPLNLMTEANYRAAIRIQNSRRFYGSIHYFNRMGILNQTTFTLIVNCKDQWTPTLVGGPLERGNILTEANLLVAFKHQNPSACAQAILNLHEHQLLTPQLLALIAAHNFPQDLAEAIVKLQERRLLTDGNIDLIANHQNPQQVVEALAILSDCEISTKENIERVLKHQNPVACAQFLEYLSSDKPGADDDFIKDDFETIIHSSEPLFLVDAWDMLIKAGIFTPENKKRLADYGDGYGNLAEGLVTLHHSNILTEENIAFISQSGFPHVAAQALAIMQETKLLNVANRNRLSLAYPEQFFALKDLHHKKLLDKVTFEWLTGGNKSDRSVAIREVYQSLNAEILSILRSIANLADLIPALNNFVRNAISIPGYIRFLMNHESPRQLAQGFVHLKNSNLLEEYFEWLSQAKGDPAVVALLICKLHGADLLTDQNRLIASDCKHYGLVEGLDALLEAELFTEENFKAAAAHANPMDYCKGLKLLWEDDILVEEYRLLIANNTSPGDLALVFHYLKGEKLLTSERAKQAAELNVHFSTDLIYTLKTSNNLNAESWNEALTHPDIYTFEEILSWLQARDILTSENRRAVAKHQNLAKLKIAVLELNQRDMLTEENFLLVVERPDPYDAIALLPQGK